MVFGREVELGFAHFKAKENPFTSITRFGSSALFGSSSSSPTTSFGNDPPANTTGYVAGIPSGLFGMPTANSFPTTSSAPVATQPPPDFVFGPCRDTHPPLFSQNSTSGFHQPSGNPFSDSQTTTGRQQSSGWPSFSSGSSTTGLGFYTASSTGNQPYVTNPTTTSAALFSSQSSTCSSAPSSTVFSSDPWPPLFSTTKCSQSGGQHSSGWTPCSSGGLHLSGRCPFSSCTSRLSAVSQSSLFLPSLSSFSDGQHSSGWSPFSSGISRSLPFGVPLPSSTSLFNVDPLPRVNPFNLDTSVTTSPFQTRLPFSGLVAPTVDSRLRASTTSSTGPFTKSFVQENNTSSNSVSVFVPFTRSNLRLSDIHGTRICSYAPTPVEENILNGELCSISAMPMYKEKSHEELRLEDYQLSSLIPTSSSSSSAAAFNSFSFINTSSSNSFSIGPSVSTTCTSGIATSSLPNLGISGIQGTRICSYRPTPIVDNGYVELNSISAMPFYMGKSHEELRLEDYQVPSLIPTSSSSTTGVISVPLSIEIRHLGDLLATTQITIPVPSSGTVAAFNSATVTESIISSIPETVSTGGFRPTFHWSTENRQTPVKPVDSEARDTLPTTATYGISSLPISENGERRQPIEKDWTDDEVLDVKAILPKLKYPDYYTVPSMFDLLTNELKRPGFCSQVKDFVIGKRGCGSIKFLGETDVRNLDVASMVRFNTREVIFCMDKKAKQPIGQGLNKAAEITLNVNCIDKNTGKEYIDGPKVDRYKQLLVRQTMEQGAEFLSFDPVKGEWKFKVQHF